MSGAPVAVEDMLANMNHGGRVAMLGLPKDPLPHRLGPGHHAHDHASAASTGARCSRPGTSWASMLATSPALRDAVRSVITHRFPAEQWQDAFDAARSGQCGKVVLDWS